MAKILHNMNRNIVAQERIHPCLGPFKILARPRRNIGLDSSALFSKIGRMPVEGSALESNIKKTGLSIRLYIIEYIVLRCLLAFRTACE